MTTDNTGSKIIHHADGATSFVGPEAVNVFACLTVASALKLYAKTGMKANRAYTPSNMLAFVERTTGQKFKRGQYMEAAEFLREWAQAQRTTQSMDTTKEHTPEGTKP
jgi:hypothetical protein